MVSSRNERRVYLWRVCPSVKPSAAQSVGAKTATLEEIICILEGEYSAGRARAHIAMGGALLKPDDLEAPDNKNQIFVAEIKRDPSRDTVTLLISRGDPNASPPAFFDMKANGKVRVENPKPPEALGWSAHLCIQTLVKGGFHRACFESQPGLSGTLVQGMLDQVLKAALDKNPHYVFEISKMEKNKPVIDRKQYYPFLDVARMPSEQLVEDLKKGSLSSITLTQKTSSYGGLGMKNIISQQEQKLVLHTKKDAIINMPDFIKNVMGFAKDKNYEKVTFQLENLPGGMTSQPTISVTEADAMEVLYVRAQRLIGFSNLLESAYESVNLEIENKMIALLTNENNW